MRISALLLVAALAISSAARADDAPGLALAKQVVDEIRGDAHKEKMRIVWPEMAEAAPPEGAEVVLITGYISYEMTRLVWREGKVEARSVATSRSWFYNKKGESYDASEFDVDAAAFARSWNAAKLVVGAKDELAELEPEGRVTVGIVASHESRQYVRLRLADALSPLHCSDPIGSVSEDIDWYGIRDYVEFALFERLLPDAKGRRRTAPESWTSWLVGEVRRATARPDLRRHGQHGALLEVALRVVGEFGDVKTLEAVEELDAQLARDDDDRSEATRLREEANIARTKLTLSLRWDSAAAARAIHANPHRKNWQEDLAKWIRKRFREKDPAGYTAMLSEDACRPGADSADIHAAFAELRFLKSDGVAALRARGLTSPDPNVRVAAACATLDVDPHDEKARVALLAVADDRSIEAPARGVRVCWSRVDALHQAVERRLLGAKELRARLADPRPEHAHVVEALLDLLNQTPERATDVETRAAWRRVVDGPVSLGVWLAVTRLVDLRDVEYRARIAEAVDRLESEMKAGTPASVAAGLTPETIVELRNGVARLNSKSKDE